MGTIMMISFLNKRAALLPPRMGNLQFGSFIKSGGYRFGRTRGKATGTSRTLYYEGRTEEELVSMYEEWLVENGKSYNMLEEKDKREKDKRFKIFKDNLRYFDKINSANRDSDDSTVGLGPFTDLTNKEFKVRFFPRR